MSNIIESLVERETAKNETAAADYSALVDKLVAGESPDVKQAEKILTAAGRSAADLATAVTRVKRIVELENAIAAHDAEIERLAGEIDRQSSEREKLRIENDRVALAFAEVAQNVISSMEMQRLTREQRATAQQELSTLKGA